MRPLPKLEIRNLDLEIEERLQHLRPLQDLVVVRSFKGGECYGVGLNNPRKDLILRNLVRLMHRTWKPYPEPPSAQTLTDTGGTDRTIYGRGVSGSTSIFWVGTSATATGVRLGFGNPAAPPTPARTDTELAALVAMFNPSATTIDETNWRVIVTGSYVWAAGGTVRETGLYDSGRDSGFVDRHFLIFHDAVSDVVVPAGGTVSVTYTTQF